MPHLPATFSAVTPMWQSSKGSVRAPTIMSEALVSPMRAPQRIAGTPYRPRLIDSAPPPRATSVSPSMTSWAAETIACSPDPHSRLRVKAGVSTGRPPFTEATRDRYMSRVSVWMTLPNTVCPTSAGSTPDRLTASRTTAAPRSAGGMSLRLPPYFPTAVRTPERTTTSRAPATLKPPCLATSHVQPAVDPVDLPGDVPRLGVGEELDHPGDLGRLPQPADRDLGDHLVEDLLGHGRDHLGGDEPGRDRVDRDPLAGRLKGQAVGQPEQARLGGRVVGLADVALLADDRADVDDPAVAAVQHMLEHGMTQIERARQVNSDHPVPVLGRHLADGAVDGDAGVVDQDVQLPVLLQHLGDDPLAVGGDADVALVDGRPLVGGGELLGRVRAAGIPDGHLDAALGEPGADRQPDPAGASGDERDLPVHTCHVRSSPVDLPTTS